MSHSFWNPFLSFLFYCHCLSFFSFSVSFFLSFFPHSVIKHRFLIYSLPFSASALMSLHSSLIRRSPPTFPLVEWLTFLISVLWFPISTYITSPPSPSPQPHPLIVLPKFLMLMLVTNWCISFTNFPPIRPRFIQWKSIVQCLSPCLYIANSCMLSLMLHAAFPEFFFSFPHLFPLSYLMRICLAVTWGFFLLLSPHFELVIFTLCVLPCF